MNISSFVDPKVYIASSYVDTEKSIQAISVAVISKTKNKGMANIWLLQNEASKLRQERDSLLSSLYRES